MDVTPDHFFGELMDELSIHADLVRAASEQAYLKSQREFLGVTVPVARKVVARLVAAHGVTHHDDVIAVAECCWEHPSFDARRAATEVLTLRHGALVPADLAVLEVMLRDAETWAIVDGLATKVVGSIVTRFPDDTGPVLDRWAADPDSFWIRRSAMLALLDELRAGGGDWERFCRYADAMLHEKEFFIRKAIGWILRDTSKKRPDLVWEYVEPRLDDMSGVTRREALKYLGRR
jgi:3-methyladenine DNA glycosylase AlkD